MRKQAGRNAISVKSLTGSGQPFLSQTQICCLCRWLRLCHPGGINRSVLAIQQTAIYCEHKLFPAFGPQFMVTVYGERSACELNGPHAHAGRHKLPSWRCPSCGLATSIRSQCKASQKHTRPCQCQADRPRHHSRPCGRICQPVRCFPGVAEFSSHTSSRGRAPL